MKSVKVLCLSICSIFLLVACSSSQQPSKQIASFSFTDQDGKPFGTDQLNGEVWIADFIFTNCTTVCPQMTAEMADLQATFKEKNIDVQFVSFTVDPDFDTPVKLKEHIGQFTDDESNWHMLTGFSQAAIERFAVDQFQTIVQKPKTSSQVIHGTNFYVIDQKGRVVNEYNYAEEAFQSQIIEEVERLLK